MATYKRLEEVCEILDAQRVPITAKDRESGIYPYYGANGLQDYVADYIFDDELVLIAEDGGNFGSKDRPIAYRVSGKCWVNNHAHVLKPREGVDVDYLCYALMFYNTDGIVNGATRQKLTQAALREMKIPYRTIQDQHEIVKRISKVFSLIVIRQNELKMLDNLVKSRFLELFGDLVTNDKKWSQQKISSVCIEIVDCINKTAPVVEEKTNYKMIRTTNVRNGSVNIVDVKYVTKECFEKWTSRSVPQDRDVLLTREAPMGQVGILFGAKNDIFLGQRLVSYRCDETVMNPVFLLYQMMSIHFQNQIEKCGKGSTVKHIPVPDCTEFRIFVPPIDKQRAFEDFVTRVDKSKGAVIKSLQELETLKSSLMQQYFG